MPYFPPSVPNVSNATGTLPVANGGTGNAGAAWTTYAPTVTPGAGSFTTLTTNRAAYMQIGKTVYVEVDITVTSAGTAATSIAITPPVTPNASSHQVLVGREDGVSGLELQWLLATGAVNTYLNTAPAIQNTARYLLGGVYEAA